MSSPFNLKTENLITKNIQSKHGFILKQAGVLTSLWSGIGSMMVQEVV